MQGLVAESDERVMTEWYTSYPQEAREEWDFWNTRATERRVKRRDERAERQVAKAAAKAQLHLSDNWATDDPSWAALIDEISDSSDFDFDLSLDEDFFYPFSLVFVFSSF